MPEPIAREPKTNGTRLTQMRLDDAVRAKIETIRVRFGLPSKTAAVRLAVDRLSRELDQTRKVQP